jgi:hypothetical protein
MKESEELELLMTEHKPLLSKKQISFKTSQVSNNSGMLRLA